MAENGTIPEESMNLTLIVAATKTLGIGKNGGLPWRLRNEMKYFARVTTRVGPSSSSTTRQGQSSSDGSYADDTSAQTHAQPQNAVIMGRKTWDSIPAKFRPLKDRVNVVLSSTMSQQDVEAAPATTTTTTKVARDMNEALAMLTARSLSSAAAADSPRKVSRVFVIGGYAVYKAALARAETDRVLLTRVHGDEWDCDTFFPVDLDGEPGWRRAEAKELLEWTGEDEDVGGMQREGEVEYEYCMYVKR